MVGGAAVFPQDAVVVLLFLQGEYGGAVVVVGPAAVFLGKVGGCHFEVGTEALQVAF